MSKVKKLLLQIYYYLPIKFLLKNIILFESNPDFSDNPRAVYDKLLELGYNKKNKLVWLVSDSKMFSNIKDKNVIFIDNKNIKKVRKYTLFAKYIVDCNNFIHKRNKYQFRIHLTHGSPIKYVKEYSDDCGEVDYVITTSDFFRNINCELFHVSDDKVITTGFPRNDILLTKNNYYFYPEIKRSKTICWLPTYRNHQNHSSGKKYFPYGIPSINNEDELKKMDKLLKKESCLLIVKLHPVEDLGLLTKMNLDNIKFLDKDFLSNQQLTIYHYLVNVDALITDYSSIYYDFLLTKKPIGLAIEDLDEYMKNNQIFYEKYQEGVVGEYIYDFNDLLKFIENVSHNKDDSYDARMIKRKEYFKYLDNKASERIVSILQKKGLKS